MGDHPRNLEEEDLLGAIIREGPLLVRDVVREGGDVLSFLNDNDGVGEEGEESYPTLRLLRRVISNKERQPPPLRLLRRLAVHPAPPGGNTNTVQHLSSLMNRNHTIGAWRKTRKSLKEKWMQF